MAFGSTIHAVIEAYYQGRLRGEVVELPELAARLDELWQNHGYPTLAAAEADHRKAHETVRWFVAREEKLRLSGIAQREIVASEQKVTLELPEFKLRLRGRIDAYYQTPAGIEIRDFKTGRTKTDADKLADEAKKHFQLRTYALAYEVMNGKAPAYVTLDYVVTRVEGSAELSSRILVNHRAKLGELAERIRLRDFAPAPASEFHKCAAVRFYGDADDEEGAS
jgi:ATP-dependent exoDNAse (exonuclease V) beta subunit